VRFSNDQVFTQRRSVLEAIVRALNGEAPD
jgi:hypothetical protein